MNEQDLHNDPWKKKLEQVPVPDVEESWNDMHLLLDRELPVTPRDNRSRWLLLLVLLLCIGVCNCPGVWRYRGSLQKHNGQAAAPLTRNGKQSQAPQPSGPGANKRVPPEKPALGSATITQGSRIVPLHPAGQTEKNTDDSPVLTHGDTVAASSVKAGHPTASIKIPGKDNLRQPGRLKRLPAATSQNRKGTIRNNTHAAKRAGLLQQDTPSLQPPLDPRRDTVTVPTQGLTDSIGVTAGSRTDTAAGGKEPVQPPADKTADTSNKAAKKSVVKAPERGWAFAIGLNHFVRIGGQEPAAFNSDGTSGVLADYIPVPQLRYYFGKKAYVQAELQLNTPQYTQKLLASQAVSDTFSTRPRVKSSVFIRKLFYSNLPVSVHYSPFDNFFIGTGLQFSTLRNAVALYDEKQLTPNRPDSTITEKLQRIKGDSTVYSLLNTREWRFLVDVNYRWRRFTPGIRYNRAFTRFINVRVSGTEITQARNESLQLYVRYDLWRKPGRLLSAAK